MSRIEGAATPTKVDANGAALPANDTAPVLAGSSVGPQNPGRGVRGPGGGGGRGPGGGRRSPYADRDLTSGSIPRNLFHLAWPQFIESILRVVDQVADLIWAGFFGHVAIAGIGAAQQFAQLTFTARMGMDWAMRAMVSRAIGMGNPALANQVVVHAVTISFVYCLVLAFIGIYLTDHLLRLIGVSEAVVEQGATYMRVQFVGQLAIGMQNLAAHSLAAAGDTVTPMKSAVISRFIHVFLSPALVFGLVGLPAIGIAGAALANVIAHVVALTYLSWVLFTGRSRLHLTFRGFRFDPAIIKQLIKIGLPAVVNGMERSLAQLLFLRLVTPFGDIATAAYTITRRTEMFSQLGSQGLGQAAGIIVGQSLGAGKPLRARNTILWACGFGLIFNGILTVLIVLFPDLFMSLFARDPEFLEQARTWLLIQAVGYAFTGLTQVASQSFQGAGDTLIVMIVTLVTMWGSLPLALFLSQATDLGVLGIAWAMCAPMLVRPLILVPYIFWGRWSTVKIFA
ncbi:MAG: MATE family efflux transporter [Chloroflexi bacterium]|nr:MATE family efflux transporter [Chloroflexota bacterium]